MLKINYNTNFRMHALKYRVSQKFGAYVYFVNFIDIFQCFYIDFDFFSMKEIRAGIIRLFEQGKSGYQIAKDMGLHAGPVNKIIKRYRETGTYEDRKRSGRPRTARTPANKRKIKGRIQRNKSNRKNSIRKMATAVGTSKSSVHRILHEDIGANAWKEMKAHGLTDKAKEKRRIRCLRLVFSKHRT